MSTAAQPTDRIRSQVLRGIAWKVVSQLVRQGSRAIVAIILARLLAPHDFGLAAMVVVLSGLVLIFSDLALGAALVQRRNLTEKDKSTVFWTSLVAGVVFTVIGVACSGLVADFYGEPDVKPLFAALSLSFFITSLATVQTALLTREMDFKSLELRQIAATIVGAAVGISAAANGLGAWAIIAQQLTIAGASTILLWRFCEWKPRFTYSWLSFRDLGAFGGRVFGTRLLFYANRSADVLLIGRFLGAAAVGAYSIAYSVILFPFNQIAGPIQEVLYPAFSKMQEDPARMASMWIGVNRAVAAVSIPSLVGIIIVAPDFVAVVLGSKWAAAVLVIQILAWVGLLQSLQRLNSSILEARNRTKTLFRYSIVVLVASLAGFIGGLHWGIVGVATGYAISSTIVEPYYSWLTARALDVSLWTFVRAMTGVVIATGIMAACVLGTRVLLVDAGLSPAVTLTVEILVGVAVYVPCCLWRVPEITAEIRGIRSRRSARHAVAAGS